MTQIATVTCLTGASSAQVMVRRQSACGHDCASCGGCGPENATKVTVVAENKVGAKPGDTVTVESESRAVLGMATLLYLVPFLLLFAGYFFGSGVLRLGEAGSILLGIVCLAVGLGGNWLLDHFYWKKRRLQFQITEVLKPCSDT